jgi:cytochrome c peroxidase
VNAAPGPKIMLPLKRFKTWCAGTAVLAAAAALLAACGGGGTEVQDTGLAQGDWVWRLPAQFPLPRVPADNAMSLARFELGRFLFNDVRLSGNGTQACGSCHQQDKAFTDGRATAVGSTGQAHPRNTQSIVNVVYNTTLTWANPLMTELELQARVPLFGTNPVEMGVTEANQDAVLARLAADTRYPAMFAAAFPGDAAPIGWTQITKAIAAFQRGIVSGASKYDRWLAGTVLLTESEQRGKDLFSSEKAECFHCHTGFNFNDQVSHAGSRTALTPFHNTGLYNIDGQGGFPFPNRGVFELDLVPAHMGRFRAPSLRNVAVTAPYMHDGSIVTLEEVLDFYAAGGRNITSGPHAGDGRLNPFKSDLVGRIKLSAQDKADLVAFLRTLTDDDVLTNARYANPFAAR